MEENMTHKQGTIDIGSGYTFKWMLEGNKSLEIYGWVEKDHKIIKGTSGFYRTENEKIAAQIAMENLLP